MTPERMREIYREVTGLYSDIGPIGELFARKLVNEALEDAAIVCTDLGAMYCQNAIRALKLPE